MKTTIELPDELFRHAKATAARRGTPLKRFVEEALAEKLARETAPISPAEAAKTWPVPPPDVPIDELRRIDALIEEEFEQIEPDDLE